MSVETEKMIAEHLFSKRENDFEHTSFDREIAFYEKNQGYLCPVWTDEGLLVAFQIRLDNPFQKR